MNNTNRPREHACIHVYTAAGDLGGSCFIFSVCPLLLSSSPVNGACSSAMEQQVQAQVDPLLQKVVSCQQKIVASQLQHKAVSSVPEKGTPQAASLLERLSYFR